MKTGAKRAEEGHWVAVAPRAPASISDSPGFLKATVWVLAKDLRQQWRSPVAGVVALTYGLLTVFVLGFAGGSRQQALLFWPVGLWLCIALAGNAALHRAATAEASAGGWTWLMLTPVPRLAIFAAKTLANWIYLTVLQCLVQLGLTLVSGVPEATHLWKAPFIAVSLLAGLGYSVVGTALSLLAIGTDLSEVFFSLLLLPLLVPVLLSAISAASVLLLGAGWTEILPYLRLLIAFDLTFVAAAWLLWEAAP